jgi:hypothetical protein
MKGYYAFWRYDVYPFILGGTITNMDKNGFIETEEYGVGRYFKPMAILPGNAGKELHHKIKVMTDERNTALEKFNLTWRIKISELIKVLS